MRYGEASNCAVDDIFGAESNNKRRKRFLAQTFEKRIALRCYLSKRTARASLLTVVLNEKIVTSVVLRYCGATRAFRPTSLRNGIFFLDEQTFP